MERATQLKLDADMVSQLACPACFGHLRMTDTHVTCESCARAYPVIDGIPVLIVDRAERLLGRNKPD